jgi:hypothetical protein
LIRAVFEDEPAGEFLCRGVSGDDEGEGREGERGDWEEKAT